VSVALYLFPPAAAPSGYTGWLRLPGQPWRPVATALTFDDALAALLAAADRAGTRLFQEQDDARRSQKTQ
jgi:hypothetical protein